jgi:hypothetical protein
VEEPTLTTVEIFFLTARISLLGMPQLLPKIIDMKLKMMILDLIIMDQKS